MLLLKATSKNNQKFEPRVLGKNERWQIFIYTSHSCAREKKSRVLAGVWNDPCSHDRQSSKVQEIWKKPHSIQHHSQTSPQKVLEQ